MTRRLIAPALLAVVCILLGACAGGSAGRPPVAAAPAGGFALPAPATLAPLVPAARAASYTDVDLVRYGDEFEASLPNQLIAAEAGAGVLSPSYPASSSGLTGLAYALYAFANLGDFDRDEVVNSIWWGVPAANTAYVGLANWSANRWDWFVLDGTGHASITPSVGGPLANYIDDGGALLAAVVLTGETPGTLLSLRVGTHPPIASFSANPAGGNPPLEITFDASSSSDDGSIVKYEWDLDGDGSYETDSGTETVVQHTYTETGSVPIRLRVTDNLGVTGTVVKQVSIYSEWNHTWGKSLEDSYKSVEISGTTAFVGGEVNQSGNLDANLHAYSLDGTPLWRMQWDSGGDDSINDLTVSYDRLKVYTVGATTGAGAGGSDWLVQAWDSTTGSVLWTRTLGNAGTDIANAVVLLGTDLYVCGSGTFEGGADRQLAVARFTTGGDVVWQRSWGGGDLELCASACLLPTFFGSSTLGVLGRTSSFDGGDTDLLFLSYDQDGGLISARTWGDDDTQYPGAIVSSLFQGTYVSAIDFKDPDGQAVLLTVNDGAPEFARGIGSGDGLNGLSLMLDGGTLVFTGGRQHPEIDNDIYLGRLDLDSLSLTIQDLAKTGTNDYGTSLALMPGGYILVCGVLEDTAGINWQPYAGTLIDRTAIPWVSVEQDAVVVDGTLQVVNLASTAATGTEDSGGGDGDCFIGVRGI